MKIAIGALLLPLVLSLGCGGGSPSGSDAVDDGTAADEGGSDADADAEVDADGDDGQGESGGCVLADCEASCPHTGGPPYGYCDPERGCVCTHTDPGWDADADLDGSDCDPACPAGYECYYGVCVPVGSDADADSDADAGADTDADADAYADSSAEVEAEAEADADADAGCLALCQPCTIGLPDSCCTGNTCQREWTGVGSSCLPDTPPDPSSCPSVEPAPGTSCDKPGIICSFGMMTVCRCDCSGWECAY